MAKFAKDGSLLIQTISPCLGHPLFIAPKTFARVQAVLAGHNRPKYSKREVAFRGLMNCAHDGCMLTGDVQKEKYMYYRCTSHRGKCDLPRFREEDIADRLGEPLKECPRKSGSAQKALFELFSGRCKCHACLQLSIQCDLRKSQNRRMVGTTRFEQILEITQSE